MSQVCNIVIHSFYRLYSIYSYKLLAVFPVLYDISMTKQIPYLILNLCVPICQMDAKPQCPGSGVITKRGNACKAPGR